MSPPLSTQQRDRLDRLWAGFERSGLLQEAVVNGARRLRALWQSPSAEMVGLVDDARPSVTVLDHEYGSAARGDVIDLGESRYTVTRVAANGLGQTELFLESVE